jgi:putative spermidine/putrescine transport system substrate-binding protein|tara:strand:- start:914 stop:2080 length:1167 start_codon:yes stop_codon:yes gene_type:complete
MKSEKKGFLYSNHNRRELLKTSAALGGLLGVSSLLGYNTAFGATKEINFWASATLDIEDSWSRLKDDLGIEGIFTDNGNDPGPIVTRMIVGNANDIYDVLGLQGGSEKELAVNNAISPWDTSKIPNYDKVWQAAKDIPYLYHDGKQFGLPSVINADSMIYLEDKVGTIDSYGAIFDPKLKGKTGMEDAWINSAIFTAIYLKESENWPIDQPGNLTEDELGMVMEFLIKHKKDGQFRTFWNGWEQGVQLVANEEVWVMTGWEPIVYAARDRGINAKYAVPKEGWEGWGNNTLLSRGAVERGLGDLAHEFANWLLDGFYGCSIGEMRGYAVPTDKNIEYATSHSGEFDVEKVSNLLNHVKEKFGGKVYWQNTRPDNFQLYEEWWQKLRNA